MKKRIPKRSDELAAFIILPLIDLLANPYTNSSIVVLQCKQMYDANSKKGCQNCVDLLFGGGVAKKKGRGASKK